MNRQMRTLVVLVVAVLVAAVASFGVYRAVTRIPVREVEIATAKAIVAAREMPVGTLVTPEMVKVVDWPARTPLSGGFTRVEEVVNRGLIAAVVENEPLTANKLAPKEAGAGLPPTIRPGMRALSIKVNEVINVAGFVVPGTRVDVVTTIAPSKESDERISRVVVSNVEVLTSGTRYDQEEARKDGQAIRATVVTLMVTPIDAERITLAAAEGELMLTLRNPLDVEPTLSPGVRRTGLFASQPAPAETPARPAARRVPAPVAPPPVIVPVARDYTVLTIKAGKTSEAKLQNAQE